MKRAPKARTTLSTGNTSADVPVSFQVWSEHDCHWKVAWAGLSEQFKTLADMYDELHCLGEQVYAETQGWA